MMRGLLDSALFAAVMDAAVRGTFILLAALAATALMRRTSAAARHLVWLAALSALLLLPIARGFVPEWRVLPVAPAVFVAPAAPSAEPVSAPAASARAPAPAEPGGPAASTLRQPAPPRLPLDWTALALLAWAAGAALLGLRLAYGLARVRWMERRAVELTDDGWVRLTDGLARRLGLGRIVRLLREPGATVPMTWGIFSPVILLPREADEWDDERRRVVLAHELAHVRRWDALTQWIAHLALAVYWFNPLVWVAARKLREEREHACDDAVLEIGTRPAEYADHLLNIVRSLGTSHGGTASAALAMARRSQFEGRLLAILDNAVRRNGVSRAAGLATAAAALACLVPLAAMRPAAGAALPQSTASAASAARPPASAGTAEAVREAPVERVVADADARQGGEASLGSGLQALAAGTDTLKAERARLAARLGGLDERAAVIRATAGEPDGVARGVLMQAMDDDHGDPGLYAEIIRSALEIESATERRLVLVRVLEQSDVSVENIVAIIAATRTMPSDSERRIVITRAFEHHRYPAGPSVPAVLVESLRGFGSATEQRIVLSSLLERRRLDTPSLVSLLQLVPRMESDTERRLVLTMIAERQRVEGAAREAYLSAARSIGSETDRTLALNALVGSAPRRTSAGAPAPSAGYSAREPRGGESVWTSTHEVEGTRDGRPRYVLIRVRDAIISGERWNVRGFRTGGTLHIEERWDGHTRRLVASCDGEGNPVWSYSVDGQARAFDAAARRWMEALIRESAS
jgi:beta-lactamase regulating signal transducer with metallopeptidase domain